MIHRSFKFDYHDSSLEHYAIEPNGELNLLISLNPRWNKKSGATSSRIRFTSIKNIEDISKFFASIPAESHESQNPIEVLDIVYENKEEGRILIEFEKFGSVVIQTRNVVES